MALRLRRGTNAERQLITPAEGELIYTTDTKSVYVGDGTTAGGIIITGEFSLGDLSEVDLSTPPTVGQVLKWDGSRFVPSSDIEGSTYTFNQNDVSNNGHPINFSTTQAGTHQGGVAFVDNVRYYLDDVLISGPAAYNAGFNAAVTRRVEITVTETTPNTLYYYCYNHPVMAENAVINVVSVGTVAQNRTFIVTVAANAQPPGQNVYVIDGAQYPDLQFVVGSNNISSIFDLNDVFSFTPPDANDVLTFDGANFVSQKIVRIEGADSSIMLDAFSNTFTGNFVGDGSQLTNLPISGGTTISSIFDLSDVFTPFEGFTPDANDVLTFDGANFVSQKIRSIIGNDSTIMLDTNTNTFTGNFVGDGSQLTNLPGSGTTISSIFDLSDVFTPFEGFTPDTGDALIYDGANFVSQKIVRIEGADSSIMLDAFSNTFTGTFVGDGSQLTNLPGSGTTISSIFDLSDVFTPFEGFTPDAGDVLQFDGANFISQKIIRIEGADSSIMLDAFSNTFTGNFVGDGSQLTNLPGSGTTISSIFDLSDVFTPFEGFTPDAGDVLQFDGANFVSQKIVRIEGQDSSIMLDTFNNTFTGNFVGDGSQLTNLPLSVDGGNFVGDIQGSVFGDDSTLLVDGVNNIISSNLIITSTLKSVTGPNIELDDTDLIINATTASNRNIDFTQVDVANDLSLATSDRGRLFFGREDMNGKSVEAIIGGGRSGIYLVVDNNEIFPESNVLLLNAAGNLGLGTYFPTTKLDVRGSGAFTGEVQASDVKSKADVQVEGSVMLGKPASNNPDIFVPAVVNAAILNGISTTSTVDGANYVKEVFRQRLDRNTSGGELLLALNDINNATPANRHLIAKYLWHNNGTNTYTVASLGTTGNAALLASVAVTLDDAGGNFDLVVTVRMPTAQLSGATALVTGQLTITSNPLTASVSGIFGNLYVATGYVENSYV